MSKKKYKRLPGKKRKLIGKDTLWAGEDHLLLIESSGMYEDYRRFFYKDIQAINISKTNSETIKSFILLSISLLIFIWALWLWQNAEPSSVFLIIIGSVFLFYSIINFIRGPSCVCRLTTAVQQAKLTPVNRCRGAVKMLSSIMPEIIQHQGKLPSEDIEKLLIMSAKHYHGNKNKASETADTSRTGILMWYKILFSSCFTIAGFGILMLYSRTLLVSITGTLLGVVFFIITVITIVKQSQIEIKSRIKYLPWIVVVILIAGVIEGYGLFMLVLFKNVDRPEIFQNQVMLVESMTKINHFDYPILLAADIFSAATLFITAIAGFIILYGKNKL